MKKFLLGMVLLSSVANAANVEVIGDSTTLRSVFDTAKYDLGIEASVSFQDEFALKWMSPIITPGVSVDLRDALNSAAILNGVKKDIQVDLEALKGANNLAAFCALNAAKFTAANASCVAGADADSFKSVINLEVAYAIRGAIDLSVVAMKEAHTVYTEELVDLQVGAQVLTGSMTSLTAAQNMNAGAAGEIASLSYDLLDPAGGGAYSSVATPDKSIPISFEAPFKGTAFKAQRGNKIKLAAVAISL